MYRILPRPLPSVLDPLTELALDLRWTWHHGVDELWREVDADIWGHTHNPWLVLQNTPQVQLERLSGDPGFLQKLNSATDARRHYLDTPGVCAARWGGEAPRHVAYFSMEFGLSEALPLYAGGLGVLAGDYLKTASDLDLPMVGVGLLFQEGYFRQIIDADGKQSEAYPFNDPTNLPIQPALGADNAWLELALPILGRTLRLRVWQAQVGRSRLYLLDSNHMLNGAADRGITSKLYGGGSEMRLMQDVVLGIGGWALLDALNCEVEVCHLNEGHAALAVLERARRYMHRTGGTFHDA